MLWRVLLVYLNRGILEINQSTECRPRAIIPGLESLLPRFLEEGPIAEKRSGDCSITEVHIVRHFVGKPLIQDYAAKANKYLLQRRLSVVVDTRP